MKTRKQKTNKQKLIAENDRIWGLAVRKFDNHQCQWCKHDGKVQPGNQPHHIRRRGHKNTRWTVNNGVCLCLRCHSFRINQEPVEYAEFIKAYLAEKNTTYEYLKALSGVIWKPTVKELETIKSNLEYLVEG